ncbi:MAG: hypothetical protein KDK44_00520 [Chlamydiia bacterium]|nr:hypothetical protein [Chlamydiia bacterium]HPE85224.1 hypothetical protein [Chlamydiales bacterium]
MKAFVKWLAIIVLVGLLLGFFAWSFVPGMVSRELTKKMGVPVTVGSIGLSPWSLTVSNLVIANPAGSMMKRALVVKTIDVKAPITRYFQDKIVIDEVDLNNIVLGLEFNKPLSRDGNWTTIMNNYQRASRSQSKKDQKEKPVLVKRLIIRNMDIWIAFRDNPQGGVKRLKGIKYMELKNISSKKGIPIDEITQQVIGEMLLEVFQREGIQNMLQGIFDSATGGSGIFGGFQGLFGLEETANEEICR